jgi:ABC-type uncharacterized transport system ATPase subunit
MERKKDQEEVMKLEEERQKAVISLLLFPESFENILEELRDKMSKPVVVSILKEMLRDQKIKVIDEETGAVTFYHDSDRMNDYHYQATAKGLSILNT